MEQCSKPSDRLHREKFQGSILVSLTETHVRTPSSLAAFQWFLHIRSGLTENQGPPYSPFGPPLNPEPPIFGRSRGYIPSLPTKHHRTCKSLWGNNSQAPNALHKQNNLQVSDPEHMPACTTVLSSFAPASGDYAGNKYEGGWSRGTFASDVCIAATIL